MSNTNNTNVDDDTKPSNDPNGAKPSALVETLYGIPIVTDSIETVKKYKFGRLTFDLADAGARKVSDLAKPVSYKFSDHIEKADKIAAESVQRLSTQFPLVKEPTDKIFNTLKEPAILTFTTVKQYHEQLGSSIEDNITTPGRGFAMKVDSQLTPFVNVIEDLINKMVPDENGKTSRGIKNDVDEQQQFAQTLRVLQIALATRDRCVEKVKKQLSSTHNFTSEQLRQLQESNQLLRSATDTVYNLNQTLLGMVLNLRESVQNPDIAVTLQNHLQSIAAIFKDDDSLPKSVQTRINEYSSALLAVTGSIHAYIKQNAKNFPDYIQERLKPLVAFFEERYDDLNNKITKGEGSPLETARNILQLTTDHTLPLLRSSQETIQWYTNSLNTSFNNTTNAVKNQFNSSSQSLNVK